MATSRQWAIVGGIGRAPFLTYGTYRTRKEAIEGIAGDGPEAEAEWTKIYRAGYRAIRVRVTPE